MKLKHVSAFLVCAALVAAPFAATAAPKVQQRKDVRKMANETLAALYRFQPKAKTAVHKAAGYAVFSNFGMNLLLGGGSGDGIAVNNATRKETFMKMLEVQAGLGIGIKKFRVVFVFDNRKKLDEFIDSGWEFGGQTSAAAQLGGQGAAYDGATSVSPGVWMYQLTDNGLALDLTAKGTKYYKDDELN